MGRLDLAMKRMMKDDNIFVDPFNFLRVDGRGIDPSCLREMDPSVYLADAFTGLSASQTADIGRRLVVRGDDTRTCALLLMENQSYIDLLMPLRCLFASAMRWRDEADIITKKHRKVKDLHDSNALLSSFGPLDRLPHIYPLVLYAGKEPWNGPICVTDLLEETDSGSGLYEADCRLNIISLAELTDAQVARFKTNEMKVMATAVRLHDDKDRLIELTKTDPVFQNVNRELYSVVRWSSGLRLPRPKHKRGNNMKKDYITFEEHIKQKCEKAKESEIITNMLQEHCPITSIEKLTKVPHNRILEIAKTNNIPLQ